MKMHRKIHRRALAVSALGVLTACMPFPEQQSPADLARNLNQNITRVFYGSYQPSQWHQGYQAPSSYYQTPQYVGYYQAVQPARPVVYQPQSYGVSTNQLLAEINIHARFVAPAALLRSSHPAMNPAFITIHSTGSPSLNASQFAERMSRGLPSLKRAGAKRGGRLSWHFTVDGSYTIQHLSTYVQGGHADFNGPGNQTSIGIEMCEYRGVDLNQVMDRTARLTAYLMWKHRIPLSHVVPHYHWARVGMKPVHKSCPHFLMDGGKPGAKWAGFQSRVYAHYRRLGGY